MSPWSATIKDRNLLLAPRGRDVKPQNMDIQYGLANLPASRDFDAHIANTVSILEPHVINKKDSARALEVIWFIF